MPPSSSAVSLSGGPHNLTNLLRGWPTQLRSLSLSESVLHAATESRHIAITYVATRECRSISKLRLQTVRVFFVALIQARTVARENRRNAFGTALEVPRDDGAILEDFRNEAPDVPFPRDAIEDAKAGPYTAVSMTNALQIDVVQAHCAPRRPLFSVVHRETIATATLRAREAGAILVPNRRHLPVAALSTRLRSGNVQSPCLRGSFSLLLHSVAVG